MSVSIGAWIEISRPLSISYHNNRQTKRQTVRPTGRTFLVKGKFWLSIIAGKDPLNDHLCKITVDIHKKKRGLKEKLKSLFNMSKIQINNKVGMQGMLVF